MTAAGAQDPRLPAGAAQGDATAGRGGSARAATNDPLRGIRVVVTRPAKQAALFAQRLAQVGGEAIICPALVIAPPADPSRLSDAVSHLDRYDFALFVSANAAESLITALERAGARWPASVTAIAVGPTTCDALSAGGIDRILSPSERFDSEGVLALPELAAVQGRRIALFRGERDGAGDGGGGRELMRETLAARGASVDAVACYRRARPTFDASGLVARWRDGGVDAVVATSTEVLDNFASLIGESGRALLARTPLFVPHARIAAHASALGLANVVVTAATDAGVLAGLLEFFQSRPQPRTP
jgi:uroporphyrinogen-III synthase